MDNQTVSFDLEVIKIRNWFAEQLNAMSEIIALSEQQASGVGASGALAISSLVTNLTEEANRLVHGKFRFLIIGDFNRGKSTILNAFFEQNLLPVGVTPTTAIPTFVKYSDQEKVLVHKKDGSTESLSYDKYREKYTLNSKGVKDQIKRLYDNSVGKWLNPLDCAEFFCPIEALAQGVEFIDTAGLNHTEEENQKTFSYIPQCHAILFVLAADQQFTQQEQDYLKKLLGVKQEIEDGESQQQVPLNQTKDAEGFPKKHARPIFYLINKWELVEEEHKEEIHEYFVESFCDCLDIGVEESERLWGDKVFDVYAKTALDSLKQGKSLEGTGLKEFQKRLSDFLIEDRLITELAQAVYAAEFIKGQVVSKVDERLLVLRDDVKSLENKIDKSKPYVALMKEIVRNLESHVKTDKQNCTNTLGLEYSNFFNKLIVKFEREFEMPPVDGLTDTQRAEYIGKLQEKLAQYRQDKLTDWQNLSQGMLLRSLGDLKTFFDEKLVEYSKSREDIRDILSQGTFALRSQKQSTASLDPSVDEANLSSAGSSAVGKMILGAGGGTVGVLAGGVGAATLANLAGAHIVLGTIGAGLALTPVGWALLGASAIAGGGLAWWQRRGEVQRFQKQMLEQVKQEFEKLVEPSKVSELKERVGKLFDPFEELARKMVDDAASLEASLNNLLESKKTTEVNYEAEEERLQALVTNVAKQCQTIINKYQEIHSEVIKQGSVDVGSNL